jgi:hypothetical protein
MNPTDLKAELFRSLARLVRGLSALFWGLPFALVACFHTVRGESLQSFWFLPPVISTGLLLFGIQQMTDFQKQERVWRASLDRATCLSAILCGVSPFFYWWNKIPENFFFTIMVIIGGVAFVFFLGSLNFVLRRLGAILPDESLRMEIKQFTALNLNLLAATFVLVVAYVVLDSVPRVPIWTLAFLAVFHRSNGWFLIMMVLLPLAMTMALLWKTKEVILESIFSPQP